MLPPGLLTFTLVLLSTSFWCPVTPARGPTFQKKKVIRMQYFENCENKVYPFQFVGWTFARNRTLLTSSGEEIVSRDISDPMTILYRMDRCKDRYNPDTCEYLNTWKWEDLCAIVRVLPFLKRVNEINTPPLACPFKKGHYYVKEAKFEASSLTPFLGTMDGSQVMWKFRMEMMEKNQTFACINFAITVPTVRVKS